MADLMKRGIRDRAVAQLRLAIEELQRIPVDESCTGCAMYGGDGFCTRWKVFVPERNVPDGCHHWTDKEVPY